MLSDEAFAELRAEFKQALPAIIAGAYDRTDLMRSTERAKERLPRVREIVSAVSHASGIDFMAIIGRSHTKEIAKARAAVCLLANELRPDLAQAGIADAIKKDPATIRTALRRAHFFKTNDNDFVHWYAKARRRLGYA